MTLSEAAQERLSALEKRGRLTPSVVVEDARDPSSPLHEHFDWDADRAAMRYWLDRAREIIRVVHVIIETEDIEIRVPYYLRDCGVEVSEQGYVSLPMLVDDGALARKSLIYELTRAVAYMQRAMGVASALGLEDQVQEIIRTIEGVAEEAK